MDIDAMRNYLSKNIIGHSKGELFEGPFDVINQPESVREVVIDLAFETGKSEDELLKELYQK
jgi:hypothetical protein